MEGVYELALEICGTIAFAASGAMVGLRKHMDIFGVMILGITTAVGGGIIRDLLLGNTPPVTFRDPIYILLSIAVSFIIFLPKVRNKITQKQALYDTILLFMDTLGLGVFTVVGIDTAMKMSQTFDPVLLVFVGVVTGVGGGVMRDMMAGDTPYIFVKHVYASASMAGAVLCVCTWKVLGSFWSMLLGMACIVIIRVLSAHYRWNLPRA